MENKGKVKQIKISKLRMGLKLMRLFLYTVIKRTWFLPSTSEMTVDQLFERVNSNEPPVIIDLRGEEEFNGNGQNSYMTIFGHIPNAKHIPIMDLASNLEDLQPYLDKEIITICPGGGMSLVAVDIMVEAGFQDVKSLKGGINLWNKKGYPLERVSTS